MPNPPNNPMQQERLANAPRCLAQTRQGGACQSPAAEGAEAVSDARRHKPRRAYTKSIRFRKRLELHVRKLRLGRSESVIDHSYKCIFIHQRKCAGISIIRSFGITPRQRKWHSLNDGVLSEEPDKWENTIIQYPHYLVFSVVRNPWDRFVSGWKYCRSTRQRDLIDVLRSLPVEGHDYRHVTRLQSAILYDRNGFPVFHELMRFETLQSDFDRVCDRLGKPRIHLPHSNRADRGDYRTYFNSESEALFATIFKRDIEMFGYSF